MVLPWNRSIQRGRGSAATRPSLPLCCCFFDNFTQLPTSCANFVEYHRYEFTGRDLYRLNSPVGPFAGCNASR